VSCCSAILSFPKVRVGRTGRHLKLSSFCSTDDYGSGERLVGDLHCPSDLRKHGLQDHRRYNRSQITGRPDRLLTVVDPADDGLRHT
jgi:hypothetical protein